MKNPQNTYAPKRVSKNIHFLKTSNRGAIIRALALNKATTRTALAKNLKLTNMAISKIVNELMSESIIVEIPIPQSIGDNFSTGNGRKPIQLAIRKWSINTICINIRRYCVSAMIMDINGNTDFLSSTQLPPKGNNDVLLDILVSMVDKLMSLAKELPIIGIGISSIGPLDIYKNRLLNPPDFCNISDVDIGTPLSMRFNLPVFMDNDMNSSALAEYYFGNGQSHKNMVFLGFSSGVGAGVIMKEKLIHGCSGFAGEVGHISINPSGSLCPCGQHGCIELYTRGEYILKNIGVNSFLELNHILDSDAPPQFVLNSLQSYKDAMCTLMVTIANCYDPEVIVLGDIDITFITRFIPEFESYMNKHMLNQGYKTIKLLPSTLGESAPLYGSGSIVFKTIFDGSLPLINPKI